MEFREARTDMSKVSFIAQPLVYRFSIRERVITAVASTSHESKRFALAYWILLWSTGDLIDAVLIFR